MTRRDAPSPATWYPCQGTGKRGYLTRADARRARARTRGSGADEKAGSLSIYRCQDRGGVKGCGWFHIGHLPKSVVQGDVPRGEVYHKPRDTPEKT